MSAIVRIECYSRGTKVPLWPLLVKGRG
jgi:hypothetical protein